MEGIRERVSKSGRTSYAVPYRLNGRQTSKTFEAAPPPHPPEKFAADFRALIVLLSPEGALRALNVDEDKPALTVDQLADRFLEWKGRPGEVTDRTLRDYHRDVDNWIRPWFGHQPADAVDEVAVQRWVDHMAERLSPKSVADRHMLLHSMYDFGRARTRKLVEHNPCKETELPRRAKKRAKGTAVHEYRAILEHAGDDARDLVEFIGETGWRFSEAAALPVWAVEDDGADVWVNVVQVFRLVDGKQVLVADEAKSWAAFRRIRLFPDSAATVRRRIVGRGPNDLVFTNSRGRHWNQNTFLRDTWPAILRRAELWQGPRKSPTPHWLRHMHVAVLVAAGAQLPEIQRRIGHESIQTTINVYGGMVGDISHDAIGRAAALMRGRDQVPADADVIAGQVVESSPGELPPGSGSSGHRLPS